MGHDDLKMLCSEVFGCRRTIHAVPSEKKIDTSSASTPFSFSLEFPESTYAEAGDEADVIVKIVSTLKIPLRMLKLEVCFLFESVLAAIPNDGIVLEPEKVVCLGAKLCLPRYRVFGSALNRSGTARVRPYCSGLTQAGEDKVTSNALHSIVGVIVISSHFIICVVSFFHHFVAIFLSKIM